MFFVLWKRKKISTYHGVSLGHGEKLLLGLLVLYSYLKLSNAEQFRENISNTKYENKEKNFYQVEESYTSISNDYLNDGEVWNMMDYNSSFTAQKKKMKDRLKLEYLISNFFSKILNAN